MYFCITIFSTVVSEYRLIQQQASDTSPQVQANACTGKQSYTDCKITVCVTAGCTYTTCKCHSNSTIHQTFDSHVLHFLQGPLREKRTDAIYNEVSGTLTTVREFFRMLLEFSADPANPTNAYNGEVNNTNSDAMLKDTCVQPQ